MFVAGFIGSPAMNLLDGRAGCAETGRRHARVGSHRLRVPPEVFAQRPALARHAGREIIAGIRPGGTWKMQAGPQGILPTGS